MTPTETQPSALQPAGSPLLLSAPRLAELLGVSVRMVWVMNQDGTLGPLPIRLRGATRWKAEEVARWVQADCPPRERWLEVNKIGRGKQVSC